MLGLLQLWAVGWQVYGLAFLELLGMKDMHGREPNLFDTPTLPHSNLKENG